MRESLGMASSGQKTSSEGSEVIPRATRIYDLKKKLVAIFGGSLLGSYRGN